MMVVDLMEPGGHVACGVTAHGSPGGPLQFDRLEAALTATLHCKAVGQDLEPTMFGYGPIGTWVVICLII